MTAVPPKLRCPGCFCGEPPEVCQTLCEPDGEPIGFTYAGGINDVNYPAEAAFSVQLPFDPSPTVPRRWRYIDATASKPIGTGTMASSGGPLPATTYLLSVSVIANCNSGGLTGLSVLVQYTNCRPESGGVRPCSPGTVLFGSAAGSTNPANIQPNTSQPGLYYGSAALSGVMLGTSCELPTAVPLMPCAGGEGLLVDSRDIPAGASFVTDGERCFSVGTPVVDVAQRRSLLAVSGCDDPACSGGGGMLAMSPLVTPSDPQVQAMLRRQTGGCRGCGDPGAADVL